MTDPADRSVRSLADILREHGLESEAGTRPGTTGPVRPSQRRRRVGDPPSTRPEAQDAARGIDGGRPAQDAPSTPSSSTPSSSIPSSSTPSPRIPRFGRRRTDVDLPEPVAPGQGELFGAGPSTAAIPGLRPSRTPGVPGSTVGSRSGVPDLASTGPIPRIVLPAEVPEPEPLTAVQSALAWARFAGELVLALAVGVGVYYLFTVLWELVPYVAVVLAPVVVTGLVAGVAFWRRRHGQAQLDTRVLLVLLFAGTLLVVVPAAGLLAGS